MQMYAYTHKEHCAVGKRTSHHSTCRAPQHTLLHVCGVHVVAGLSSGNLNKPSELLQLSAPSQKAEHVVSVCDFAHVRKTVAG